MSFYVERLNLKVGSKIEWPKVEPDTVSEVIDPPTGHIVVGAKTGNIHAWWGRWVSDPLDPEGMKKVLAHHGGVNGWDDVQKPIDQHNHVVERYLGHEVKVDEIKPEVPVRPRSLEEFVVAVRTSPDIVEVSGRKAWIGEAVSRIDKAVRGITYPIYNATDVNYRVEQLLTLQPKLLNSTNPGIRSAGRNLGEAFSKEGSKSLGAFVKSEDDLLNSIIEMNDIVVGTCNRLASLERIRWRYEDIIVSVHRRVTEAQVNWSAASNDSDRASIISTLNGQLFGTYQLTSLKMQPFRRQVEDLFEESKINNIGELWQAINLKGITRALEKAESRLQKIHQKIEIRRQGARQPTLI